MVCLRTRTSLVLVLLSSVKFFTPDPVFAIILFNIFPNIGSIT